MSLMTSSGEIGVHVAGSLIVLRPSLDAMASLGTPEEIVDIFVSVMEQPASVAAAEDQFGDALAVLYACTERDVSTIFGYWSETGYAPGEAPAAHVVPLARCLLKHGIVGDLPPLPRRADDEPKYVKEFDARAHVALAMAHLGLSERQAWGVTMTGLVGALRAKFPLAESKSPGAKAPTKEEHEATMEWFERIESARKSKQGAH